MKIAVTSTVVFDVPDQPLERVARDFKAAHVVAIGVPMQTLTGQAYVLLAIERFEVAPR